MKYPKIKNSLLFTAILTTSLVFTGMAFALNQPRNPLGQEQVISTLGASSVTTLSPPPVNTNVTATSADINLGFEYTGEQNASADLQYRENGTSTWQLQPSMTSIGSTFTATVDNLKSNTTYEYEIFVTDPDGVSGSNPSTGTVTTLSSDMIIPLEATSTATMSQITLKWTYTGDDNHSAIAHFKYKTSLEETYSSGPMTMGQQEGYFFATIDTSILIPGTTYQALLTITDENETINSDILEFYVYPNVVMSNETTVTYYDLHTSEFITQGVAFNVGQEYYWYRSHIPPIDTDSSTYLRPIEFKIQPSIINYSEVASVSYNWSFRPVGIKITNQSVNSPEDLETPEFYFDRYNHGEYLLISSPAGYNTHYNYDTQYFGPFAQGETLKMSFYNRGTYYYYIKFENIVINYKDGGSEIIAELDPILNLAHIIQPNNSRLREEGVSY